MNHSGCGCRVDAVHDDVWRDNRVRLLNLSVQKQICQRGLERQIKFNSITAIVLLTVVL